MENQLYIQQQLQQKQHLPPIPPSEEQQIQYGRNSCSCIPDEFDPKRCARCGRVSVELNSHGNPVTNEVRNEYDPQMYMNHPLPSPVREQPPPDTIWFYNRHEPYYEFTNFKEGFPIKAAIPAAIPDIKSWSTSEHLFQAAKFKNTSSEIANEIRMCRTPRDAFNTARKYQQYVDPDWQSINIDVMEWVVLKKFQQHSVLARRLLETGDKKLVEHTQVDRFWGDGGDGTGMNQLGEILMRVRKQLRDNPSLIESNENRENIYSMPGLASSSTSSFHRLQGQLPPIPQNQPPNPPPNPPSLPPRNERNKKIIQIHQEQQFKGQQEQQFKGQQEQQFKEQQEQQFIQQQFQIQQQIQQRIQQEALQQQEALTQQYIHQPNAYINDDGSTFYYHSYNEHSYNGHHNM